MYRIRPLLLVRVTLIYSALALLVACASPVLQTESERLHNPQLFADHFIASDGYRLPFHVVDQPSDPEALVIALHGFNDYSKAFAGMCEFLLERDIACLAYDQRGFGGTEEQGLWPGHGKLESDLDELVTLVQAKHPTIPIYVSGESMGGAVILSAMEDPVLLNQNNIEGVVLFAPAVWGRDTQPWYQRWALEIAVRLVPSWTPTGASLEIVATDNMEALREMSRDPLVIKETRIDTIYGLTNLMDKALASTKSVNIPTLILYGDKDEVIPKEPTCAALTNFVNTGSNFTLRVYPNGYHMLTRDLQAKNVFSEMTEWFDSSGEKPLSMRLAKVCGDS